MVLLKSEILVVDSSAFLLNVQLQDFGTQIYTVSNVVNELKDEQIRNRLSSLLPYTLNIKEPSLESIKSVVAVSKETGDFSVLSATDIKLLALAFELFPNKEKLHEKSLAIKKSPKESAKNESCMEESCADQNHISQNEKDNTGFIAISYKKKKGRNKYENITSLPGFYMPKEDIEKSSNLQNEEYKSSHISDKFTSSINNELVKGLVEKMNIENCEVVNENIKIPNWNYVPTKQIDHLCPTHIESSEMSICDEEADDNIELSDDDEDGWINPQNIIEIQNEVLGTIPLTKEDDSLNEDIKLMACLTDDYAMQNVLLKMGIPIRSTRNGRMIKCLKTYTLFCKACYKTTSNMEKVFCPNCGNRSLARVAYSLDQDGRQTLHLNPQRMRNKKGTKFSIPLPQGGKHPRYSVLLREGQRFAENRAVKSKKTADDAIAACTFTPPTIDVHSKAFNLLGLKSGKGSTRPNYHSKHRGPIKNDGGQKVYKAKR